MKVQALFFLGLALAGVTTVMAVDHGQDGEQPLGHHQELTAVMSAEEIHSIDEEEHPQLMSDLNQNDDTNRTGRQDTLMINEGKVL